MSSRTFIGVIMLAAATLVAGPAAAQEPTIDQVYQAADSGNFASAQRMMDQVLSAHPNSAKAHYVEAELLARQGRMSAAAAELNNAERLEPGLSFAKPQAVQELKRRVASPQGLGPSAGFGSSATPAAAPAMGGGIPWTTLLVVAALIALAVFVVRGMVRRNATSYMPAPGTPGYGGPVPMQPYGAGAAPATGPFGGGIGSGILGGLATGAALGAGMVAGEALAHRLGDGHHDGSGFAPGPGSDVGQAVPNDMGGNDFGIADGSSWDDGGGVSGGGGGSDWT